MLHSNIWIRINLHRYISIFWHIYTHTYIFVLIKVSLRSLMVRYPDSNIRVRINLHRYTFRYLYIYILTCTHTYIHIYTQIFIYLYPAIFTYICINEGILKITDAMVPGPEYPGTDKFAQLGVTQVLS
jgi:hypothetical protein